LPLLRWRLDGLVWVVVAFAKKLLLLMLLLTTLFKAGGEGVRDDDAGTKSHLSLTFRPTVP
jgi:hypothetical protein